MMLLAETTPMVPEAFVPLVYVFLILWGLIDCFFGFRIFRLTLAILLAMIGSLVGAWLGFVIVEGSWALVLGGFVLGAVAGALFAMPLYRVAAAALGVVWAFAVVTPYLQGLPDWWFWLAVGVVCLLAAILAIYLATALIMLMTAYGGAVRVVYGVWFFLGGPHVLEFLHNEDVSPEIPVGRIVPLVAVLVLGTVGFLAQAWAERKRTG
ncbi:MAG: DUF4203 domain-containing protein [Opitutales bacterium]|nr:DUF4203 domain-containing protein [Opitutales bacterium]